MNEKLAQAVKALKEKLDKKTVTTAVGAGGFLGFIYGIDPGIFTHATDLAKNGTVTLIQLSIICVTILAGAIFHASRVSKSISENFKKYADQLTSAVDKVAEALTHDIQRHDKTLEEHGKRLDTLEKSNNPK